jgi:hypothetical protein
MLSAVRNLQIISTLVKPKLLRNCHFVADETSKKAKEDETAFMRQVITSTIQRMQTPTIEPHDLDEERAELCILNLQKVIRGRVVQELVRMRILE